MQLYQTNCMYHNMYQVGDMYNVQTEYYEIFERTELRVSGRQVLRDGRIEQQVVERLLLGALAPRLARIGVDERLAQTRVHRLVVFDRQSPAQHLTQLGAVAWW